jgi:hypothetical protein
MERVLGAVEMRSKRVDFAAGKSSNDGQAHKSGAVFWLEAFRDDFATTPIGELGVHLKYLFLLMNICSFDIPSKPPSHSVAGSIA